MPQDPSDLAAELHSRGELALERGELAEAEKLALAAAASFLAIDADHPDAANAILLRARVEHARSHYANALALAQQARAIVDVALAAYPEETIVVRLLAHMTCQVALALQGLGHYDEAEAALLPVVPILARVLSGTVEVAHVHNLLGICHKFQERFADAEASYARAAAILDGLPEDLPDDRAALEHNVGGLHHARGELEPAERHTRRAVEMRERALGPQHVLVAADLAALAAIVGELGRFDEAEQLLRRALTIFEAAFAEPHFEIGFTLGTLGVLYAAQRKWDLARPQLERARAILVGLLGPDHIEVTRVERCLHRVQSNFAQNETAPRFREGPSQ